jgi:hypothetical protein
MYVLAVSEFIRTLLIIMIATPLILLCAVAVFDVIRRRQSGWGVVGWLIVILVLPIVGPLVYFGMRKPSDDEVDRAYLGEREMQRARAGHPFDSTTLSP